MEEPLLVLAHFHSLRAEELEQALQATKTIGMKVEPLVALPLQCLSLTIQGVPHLLLRSLGLSRVTRLAGRHLGAWTGFCADEQVYLAESLRLLGDLQPSRSIEVARRDAKLFWRFSGVTYFGISSDTLTSSLLVP